MRGRSSPNDKNNSNNNNKEKAQWAKSKAGLATREKMVQYFSRKQKQSKIKLLVFKFNNFRLLRKVLALI